MILPLTPIAPAAAAISPAPPATLGGSWLLSRVASARLGGYPAEYVELRLNDAAGILHGRFQGRYYISDRAISPNVAFRFDGPSGAEGGVFSWQSAGGAKGDVTLRLAADGRLEVDWVARQLGKELDLISGAATLVRKLE